MKSKRLAKSKENLDMSKKQKKKIVFKVDAIKKQIQKIAEERDKLRALIDEAVAILETCDSAHIDFEEGIRLLESGADELSQYI